MTNTTFVQVDQKDDLLQAQAARHLYVDKLLTQLYTVQSQRDDSQHATTFNGQRDLFLQEYRTAGVHFVRQTGFTLWALKMLITHPNALLVVPATIHKHAAGVTLLDLCSDGMHSYQSAYDRIYTATGFTTLLIKPDAEAKSGLTPLLLVDDAYYVFSKLRRAKFYQWAAKHTTPNPVIMMLR